MHILFAYINVSIYLRFSNKEHFITKLYIVLKYYHYTLVVQEVQFSRYWQLKSSYDEGQYYNIILYEIINVHIFPNTVANEGPEFITTGREL